MAVLTISARISMELKCHYYAGGQCISMIFARKPAVPSRWHATRLRQAGDLGGKHC
jgi:hypothetical protein